MQLTTAFVAELIWAANQSQHLTAFEKRRMLERTIVTILEMRDQAGIPSSNTEPDPAIDLHTTAAAMDNRTDEQISAALLDAADMIRTLRVVLDSGTEVVIKSI